MSDSFSDVSGTQTVRKDDAASSFCVSQFSLLSYSVAASSSDAAPTDLVNYGSAGVHVGPVRTLISNVHRAWPYLTSSAKQEERTQRVWWLASLGSSQAQVFYLLHTALHRFVRKLLAADMMNSSNSKTPTLLVQQQCCGSSTMFGTPLSTTTMDTPPCD